MKTLRKEKGFRQEQLAETLSVSRRTVSRWETGSNLPDLDLRMEISDLYEVDLREMLNGERKSEAKMNSQMEETVLQVAEYSNAGKQRDAKIMRVFFLLGIAALCVNAVSSIMDLPENFWTGLLHGGTLGIAIGAMIMGVLYTTGAMNHIFAFKMRLLGKENETR